LNGRDVIDHTVSEEIVRLAVDACPSGMIMTDASGKIVLVNAEVERLFGYPREELLGGSIDILVPTSERAGHGGHRASFVGNPESRRMGVGRDLYGMRKDGTKVPVEIGLNPIRTRAGLMVLSAITDITERKLADERFRLVVEACPSGMIMTDENGKIVLINAEAERLFGYAREELFGKTIDILVPSAVRAGHAEHRGAFIERPEARRMGIGRDLYGVRKNGTQIPIEIGLNPIRTSDGLMILSAITDISERKRAIQVLAKRSEELERSNADLEQFANVASHDLQEPLRMVASYAELLAEHYKNACDEKAEKYIRYTVDGARRMQQLVKDLLTFSRVGTQGKMPAPVRSGIVVKNVLDSLKVAIEESHAEIVCGNLPAVSADEVQLAQVFQNLIGNALKFHGGRPPHIHIGAERNDHKWTFSVKDNGIGIEKQYGELVFQMFQRLHERGRYDGSGIGLAIAKKIVERHDGRIWFDSELGNGSTFFFTMPAVQGDIA
jgi:PAS domain S-box-containing protein